MINSHHADIIVFLQGKIISLLIKTNSQQLWNGINSELTTNFSGADYTNSSTIERIISKPKRELTVSTEVATQRLNGASNCFLFEIYRPIENIRKLKLKSHEMPCITYRLESGWVGTMGPIWLYLPLRASCRTIICRLPFELNLLIM